MKILIFSWRGIGHPHSGGAEIVTHEHAKAWVKAGHQVMLFTSTYEGANKDEVVDGVKFKRLGHQILGVHFWAIIWYLTQRQQRFDLVVDQFHGIPFFTPLFVKGRKLAFIHEVTKEIWKLNPWPKPINLIPSILGSVFEPLIFKLFYRTIPFMTVSLSTKLDLQGWGIPRKNITIVNNGINIKKIRKVPKKGLQKNIIYLGAISKDKGIEDALEVFAVINNNLQNCRFWVVGMSTPKYLKQLLIQSKKLGLKNLKFWGFVTNQKKFELLSNAHLLINPSIREGWGLVVIEAAAMGTPTIGYLVAGLKDSVVNGKTGLLCKKGDKQTMAQLAIEILENQDAYQKMSLNAFEWSKKFTWDKATSQSLKLINKVINNG